MNTFVFRNNTVECFFRGEYTFSGYGDISQIPENVDQYFWFYQLPIKYNNDLLAEEIESYLRQFNLIANSISSSKLVIAFTIDAIGREYFVINETQVKDAVYAYNKGLYDTASNHPNIKVIDFREFTYNYKANDLINWKYYFTSQILLNPLLANDFSRWIGLKMKQISLVRKKCIVLDLDNTIWGGVLGEDGPNHVAIGGNYPGNAFKLFQEALIALSKSGILLTICSKNNEKDVFDFWEGENENLINLSNIVSHRINWNNKVDNIVSIAEELNIGLDSIVFIDDNPTERAAVKESLPTVTVPDFPEQPYLLPAFIKEISEQYFKVYKLTSEDKDKTIQYQTQKLRRSEKLTYKSHEDFLQNLEMKLFINEVKENSIPRIAQLTQKTNQFNLTSHRYTEHDISLHLSDGWKLFSLSVSDKFGDYGTTGTLLINKNAIDTYLISCRILGHGIESAFLTAVLRKIKNSGQTTLSAVYIPNGKNKISEFFYDSIGFNCIKIDPDGTKHYEIDLTKTPLNIKEYYVINDSTENY